MAEIETMKRVLAGRGSEEQAYDHEHNSRTHEAQRNLCLKQEYEDSPCDWIQGAYITLSTWETSYSRPEEYRKVSTYTFNVQEYL